MCEKWSETKMRMTVSISISNEKKKRKKNSIHKLSCPSLDFINFFKNGWMHHFLIIIILRFIFGFPFMDTGLNHLRFNRINRKKEKLNKNKYFISHYLIVCRLKKKSLFDKLRWLWNESNILRNSRPRKDILQVILISLKKRCWYFLLIKWKKKKK